MSNHIPTAVTKTRPNFKTLLAAADRGDLCSLECEITDLPFKVGDKVAVCCAVNRVNGEFEFVPLAILFNGNPYEVLNPPTP